MKKVYKKAVTKAVELRMERAAMLSISGEVDGAVGTRGKEALGGESEAEAEWSEFAWKE